MTNKQFEQIESLSKKLWGDINNGHEYSMVTYTEFLGIVTEVLERLQEEPVSEELEQAIDTYLATYWGGEKEKQDWPYLKKMAIHFAQWQKEQDQETIELAEDHAMLAGMEKMKEEMIEKGTKFLKDHLEGYDIFGSDIERSVESFKLAMEDE